MTEKTSTSDRKATYQDLKAAAKDRELTPEEIEGHIPEDDDE